MPSAPCPQPQPPPPPRHGTHAPAPPALTVQAQAAALGQSMQCLGACGGVPRHGSTQVASQVVIRFVPSASSSHPHLNTHPPQPRRQHACATSLDGARPSSSLKISSSMSGCLCQRAPTQTRPGSIAGGDIGSCRRPPAHTRPHRPPPALRCKPGSQPKVILWHA